MFSIVRALMDRFKLLFMTQTVLELQADVIVACADRKADLFRRAERFEEEGLPDIAAYLRQQAEALSTEKPLASVLAVAEHLQSEAPKSPTPVLSAVIPSDSNADTPTQPTPSVTLKKSRRS